MSTPPHPTPHPSPHTHTPKKKQTNKQTQKQNKRKPSGPGFLYTKVFWKITWILAKNCPKTPFHEHVKESDKFYINIKFERNKFEIISLSPFCSKMSANYVPTSHEKVQQRNSWKNDYGKHLKELDETTQRNEFTRIDCKRIRISLMIDSTISQDFIHKVYNYYMVWEDAPIIPWFLVWFPVLIVEHRWKNKNNRILSDKVRRRTFSL